jgi:hypothetical protein
MRRAAAARPAQACGSDIGAASPTGGAEVDQTILILRRDGDDLLPVITLRGDGTEIRHLPGR